MTQIEVGEKKNGAVIDVELHNHSYGEHFVRVETETAPADWMAIRLGKPSYIIKPKRSRRVRLQVERMVQKPDPGPLMFGFRISFPSGAARDFVATFQLNAAQRHRSRR